MSSLRTVRHRLIPSFTLVLASSAVAAAALVSGTGAGGLAPSPGGAPAIRAASTAAPPAAAPAVAGQALQASLISGPASGSAVLTAYVTTRYHRTPREIARWMMRHTFHWRVRTQFRYLNRLWDRESGWNRHAYNPYSGAYGIPQAVPGSKMASAGPHWRYNAWTQIRWGLRYIRARYGSPHRAWRHSCAYGWY